jgi:hypothetical protein
MSDETRGGRTTLNPRPKPQDRVRVLRVIEYEGPRDWVEMRLGDGKVIRGATVYQFPVVLPDAGVDEAVVREIANPPYDR